MTTQAGRLPAGGPTTGGSVEPAGGSRPVRPEVSGLRHTRLSAAWTAVAIAVVLGIALIAFIVQNTRSVEINFFTASGHVPVAVALLAAAVIGALIVLVVGIFRTTQLRMTARRRSNRTSGSEVGPSHVVA